MAAALAGQAAGGLRVPAGLPARLAELLAARAGRCAGDARAVLAGLAVAGRSLTEDLLAAVTGLEVETVRRGLRELAAARLLAEDTSGGGHRPRHALLAEAVATGLLPGERAVLHERAAQALAGDQALAAEVAGHWQAAGRPAEELPARIAAAEAAERVCGCAEAAAHWQRAIELSRPGPMPPPRPGSTCRGCPCRPSTRFIALATACAPAWSPRRPTAGSPATPTPRPPRSSAIRRGRPPPRRGLPGERCAGCRAAADGGGAAAVRAGSAVIRSRRRPARLRQLPSCCSAEEQLQASRAALNRALEDRRSGRRHRADPPHPVR